jgi:hypothetical protein
MIKVILILILILLIPVTTIPTNPDSINQYSTSLDEIKSNLINPLTPQNTFPKVAGASKTETTTKKEINPNNPDVKKYFQKVANVPYKADYTSTVPKKPAKFWKDNYGDCDDKSTAFADYLYNIGAEDVKLVSITHQSQKYGHVCVMWKGRIFDATAAPPIYNMDQEKYFNYLLTQGFNLRVTYTYKPT